MAEKTERSALTLRFVDPDLEGRFQRAAGAAFAPQFRLALSIGGALWIVAGFLLPRFSTVDADRALAVAIMMALVNLAALGLSRRSATLDGQHASGTAVNVLAGLAVLWLAVDAGAVERYAAPAMMLISIFAFVVLRLRFVAAAAAAFVYLAAFGAVVWAHEPPAALAIDAFLLISAVGSAVAATYFLENAERDLFRQRERIDQLLRNILPEAIVRELQENHQAIAHKFEAATIIFADLVGFTPLVEHMPPEGTAAMLNDLYSEFDEASRRHGVEKIKTIGDSYMAASGVPERCADHAARAIAFALDLLHIVRARAERGATEVAVRIGIHSGPVVAGVIGKTKFSYDLWGDTVNVASRLESRGVAGAIQISDATRALLGDGYAVEPRGSLELKGHEPIRAYLLVDPPWRS